MQFWDKSSLRDHLIPRHVLHINNCNNNKTTIMHNIAHAGEGKKKKKKKKKKKRRNMQKVTFFCQVSPLLDHAV